MASIIVEVTADDIAHGVAANCHECPIALALMRMFPNTLVSVGPYRIFVDTPPITRHGTYRTSGRAMEFMTAFDFGKPVSPMSFELEEISVGV